MRPTQRNEDNEEDEETTTHLSAETLERWSRMAEKLRSRIDETQRENQRLQYLLERQTIQLDDLRDENSHQLERIEDLEYQCVEKSSRIASLARILEDHSTNDLEENLLQKSLEHAEMSLSVDRLRLALSKCEHTNLGLMEENESLQMMNEELSTKVEQATMAWDKAKREQQNNRKLLLQMGDVIRTLNCVAVDFEMKAPQSGGGSGEGSDHESQFENIKRKIKAMEENRQHLIQECRTLREDNDSQKDRIRELEDQSRQSYSEPSVKSARVGRQEHKETKPWNDASQPRPVDTRSETSPLSLATSALGHDKFGTYVEGRVHEGQIQTVASDVSSFSELEAPPLSGHIPIADHQQLKGYYEESLERVIRMSADLGKCKAKIQEQETTIENLQGQLDEIVLERDDAQRELNEALNVAEDVAEKHAQQLQIHKEQMRTLESNHYQSEAEYAKQLEELEQQISKTEASFQSQCEALKKQHADTVDSLERQQKDLEKTHADIVDSLEARHKDLQKKHASIVDTLERQQKDLQKKYEEVVDSHKEEQKDLRRKYEDILDSLKKLQKDLKKKHENELEAEKEKIEDLNEELDVLMELHTKLEDDLDDLQKKYDEALNTIVELEDEVRNTQESNILGRVELEKDLHRHSELIRELNIKVGTSKEEMQEAVLQQQKLRRENEIVLAKQGQLVIELDKAKQRNIENTATIKELRDICCDMEERLQRSENDGSTRLMQLQASYQMAMTKITSLAHQLYQVGVSIDESSHDDSIGNTAGEREEENLAAHEKIKRLEQELLGTDPVKYPSKLSVEGDAHKFYQDYGSILRNYAQSGKSARRLDLPQPIWCHRLIHQVKMMAVRRALRGKIYLHDEPYKAMSFDFLLPHFINHEMKNRSVRELVLSKVKSRFAPGGEKKIPDGEKKIPTEFVTSPSSDAVSPPTVVVDPGFLEHQRLLTIVHYDLLAKSELSRSPTSCSGKWKKDHPQNIDEAQSAILQLKGETQKIKLAANTAKIRYEAREKEHRVLRLQHKKLMEQYNQAIKKKEVEGATESTSPDESPNKVKAAVLKIQRDAELEGLKTELRKAELKVERMVTELRNTKTKADVTRKQQEEGEQSLQDAIRQGRELGVSPNLASTTTAKGHAGDIFRVRGNGRLPIAISEYGSTSFDVSRLTSGTGIQSCEGRDEQGDDKSTTTEKIHVGGGIDELMKLQADHDQAKRTIGLLRTQLMEIQHEAEHAKVQLKRREENLRDVIREYNQIKHNYDALLARNESKVKLEEERVADNQVSTARGGTDTEKLVRERNVALGKISLLEAEVAEARRVAKEAHKKRIVRETQLRDVIEQYKGLNEEHKKTTSTVEELRKALSRYETVHGMESRQRSHESDESGYDKRETSLHEGPNSNKPTIRQGNHSPTEQYNSHQHPGHQKNLPNLKSWFKDLGHQKGVRQTKT